MPNLCKNIVRAPKEVLEDLYDGQKVTFEKLIPMPKSLNLTEGTYSLSRYSYNGNNNGGGNISSVLINDINSDVYRQVYAAAG